MCVRAGAAAASDPGGFRRRGARRRGPAACAPRSRDSSRPSTAPTSPSSQEPPVAVVWRIPRLEQVTVSAVKGPRMSDDVSVEIRSVLTDVLDKGPEEIEASWAACAEAGLLGLAVPESHGGEGLGVAEVSVLVREVGARAGDLPVRETLCCGLLTLVRSGTPEQQETFLPQIAAGKLLVAPALNEPGRALPQRPSTRLDGDRLTGRKVAVPTFAELSGVPSLLIVSATDAGGTPVVVLLDPQSEGVSRTTTPSSRGREVEATYEFDDAPVLGVLADGAADVLGEHAIAGLLAQGDGLVAGARDLTAGYIKERTQFGRRLA